MALEPKNEGIIRLLMGKQCNLLPFDKKCEIWRILGEIKEMRKYEQKENKEN